MKHFEYNILQSEFLAGGSGVCGDNLMFIYETDCSNDKYIKIRAKIGKCQMFFPRHLEILHRQNE